MSLVKFAGSARTDPPGGGYGHVASFKNGDSAFAVKKVATSMRHRSEARCVLREIKIMQGLDHPTILGILDLWPGSGDDFSDVAESERPRRRAAVTRSCVR